MHSYKDMDPELTKALREGLIEKKLPTPRPTPAPPYQADGDSVEPLGPTGRFPEGKLTSADEGEIRFQIGVVKGSIVLNFGAPTQAIGLNPSQALSLADLLRKHAKALLPKKNHNGKARGK